MESNSHSNSNPVSNDQFFNNRYNHIATMEDNTNQNVNMNIMTQYDLSSPTENRRIVHENKIQDLIDNPSKKKNLFKNF
jgi:hypothetical protein